MSSSTPTRNAGTSRPWLRPAFQGALATIIVLCLVGASIQALRPIQNPPELEKARRLVGASQKLVIASMGHPTEKMSADDAVLGRKSYSFETYNRSGGPISHEVWVYKGRSKTLVLLYFDSYGKVEEVQMKRQ